MFTVPEYSATANFSPFTWRGCFLIRGNSTQSHQLIAFPASEKRPKLAVDPIPAKLPEKVVVPVSLQLPRLVVVSESTQIHKTVGIPIHTQTYELAIKWVPMQLHIPDLTHAPVSAQLLKGVRYERNCMTSLLMTIKPILLRP